MKHFFLILVVFFKVHAYGQELPPWKEGFLDIHHINTGSGNAAFIIFPDGTTLLFDAGDVDRSQRFKNPLKIAPASPSDSLKAGQWIALYIGQVLPSIKHIDYAVISHFHADHFGSIQSESRYSKRGPYRLSGITEVNEYLPILKLLDRDYPTYNFPVDILKNSYDSVTFWNYKKFVSSQSANGNLKAEALKIGSNNQITQLKISGKYKNFFIRNVAVNGKIWNGEDTGGINIVPEKIDQKNYNENPLSIALKISYGDFDYFTGGDLTGLQGFGLPPWFDMETPLAKIVGKVEALSLNHHGVRDGTNEYFLKTLDPQVIIQQSWSSNHPGEEVLHRLISPYLGRSKRDIFATYIHSETITTYGRWLSENYKAIQGHIVIRVSPEGKEFFVYVLTDKTFHLKVNQKSGPYSSSK